MENTTDTTEKQQPSYREYYKFRSGVLKAISRHNEEFCAILDTRENFLDTRRNLDSEEEEAGLTREIYQSVNTLVSRMSYLDLPKKHQISVMTCHYHFKSAIEGHPTIAAKRHIVLFLAAWLWNELSSGKTARRLCFKCGKPLDANLSPILNYHPQPCYADEGIAKEQEYRDYRTMLLKSISQENQDFYTILDSGDHETDLVTKMFETVKKYLCVYLKLDPETKDTSYAFRNLKKDIPPQKKEWGYLLGGIRYHRHNVAHHISDDLARATSQHIIFFSAALLWSDPEWNKVTSSTAYKRWLAAYG